MAYRITLQPSGHEFPAPVGATILDAALAAGLALPYGCRNGACGACKGKVLDGEVDYGAAREEALAPAERGAGFALFCCAKPLSDLSLECRELGNAQDIPVRNMPCRVERMARAAEDVMILTLRLPASERLQFIAGQYVEFLLKDGGRRAFSLANAPHDDEFLEIHVRRVPGGTFTRHVFEAMRERDILRFEGPFGDFGLREDSDRPILLVAGGTGFAPVKAIVEHAIHNRIRRPMTIYRGARNRAGLYLPDLPERWAAGHDHIRHVPVLSEPTADDAWTGRTGLVHEAVLADFAGRAEGLGGHQVYVCGPPAMIEAARREFAALGLPAQEFFADAFYCGAPPP